MTMYIDFGDDVAPDKEIADVYGVPEKYGQQQTKVLSRDELNEA